MRKSAKFVAKEVGLSPARVYEMWQEMGVVIKDKFGDWALTELGRSIGGKMSKGNYCPVPTFEFEVIEKKMIDFFNKSKHK